MRDQTLVVRTKNYRISRHAQPPIASNACRPGDDRGTMHQDVSRYEPRVRVAVLDWTWPDDNDELVTAYHEAGHAIVGCALGAQIDRVTLSQASMFDDEDGDLPRRFGDCIVNWGRVDPSDNWQRQRELLTILAGPVAEFVYQSGDEELLVVRAWQSDWQQAQLCAAALKPQAAQQIRLMRETIVRLRKIVASDPCWSAIAALADELMLGDEIEGEQVADLVRFWWSRA